MEELVDCPTQLTLVTWICQFNVFHNKYQWEIWKNTARKSAKEEYDQKFHYSTNILNKETCLQEYPLWKRHDLVVQRWRFGKFPISNIHVKNSLSSILYP